MAPPSDPRIAVDLPHLQGLQRQARPLSFLPRQPVRSILNGRHASKLKGRGLNFEELRHYMPGDDIRTIDWKVTARTASPYIRVYTEERDRAAMLVVDQRMSMFFGSVRNMKSVTAAEAAAIAAHRIRAQGDRVGGIVFTDDAVIEHRPKASPRALHRFLGSVAQANMALHAGRQAETRIALNTPLRATERIVRSGGLVMVFSDFDAWDEDTEKSLSRMARRNDVILVTVSDPVLETLPETAQLVVSDGGLQAQIDTRSGETRAALRSFATARLAAMTAFCTRTGIPVLPLSAAEDTLPQLLRLMGAREMRT
ncbi:DUF58 domain-containing protein [Dinoroseobacter sp. S124A]|uniref:DUF58 domain-containing protein n=1 Tax=Dinoroseobacter sp. S124A TaxID=3415128 RepID=UPI003C79D0A5